MIEIIESVDVHAPECIEKIIGQFVDHCLLLYLFPRIEEVQPRVGLYMWLKSLRVDYPYLAAWGDNFECVHVVAVLNCIYITEGEASSKNAHLDFLKCILIELGSVLIFESLICVDEAAKVGLDTLLKLRPTICQHMIYRASFIFNEPVRRFEELSLTAIFFHLFKTHYRCFLVIVDRVEVGLDDLNLAILHYIHLVCAQAFSG